MFLFEFQRLIEFERKIEKKLNIIQYLFEQRDVVENYLQLFNALLIMKKLHLTSFSFLFVVTIH